LRILLAHNFYTVTGGAEVFYHEVGRVLASQGHEVAWFSCQEDSLETPWAEYFPTATDYRGGGLLKRVLGFPKMVYNRDAKTAMARIIADFRPDIIHAFAVYVRLTPAILDAARGAGIPVVLSCNDYKHICPNYKLFHHGRICEECKEGQYHRALANRCCHDSSAYSGASMVEAYVHNALDIWRKNVSCFLFASEFMARKTGEFWGADSFRHEILRNPFDSAKYRLEGRIGDYALYFGRLIDEKGVNVLLDAAAKVPELPLVVVGEGPDRQLLESQARSLGLEHVQFVGAQWGDNLNRWLRDCRFVVVPSLWHENFPYVIFQAFAAGKPVVGSNRGGIPELVIEGERGLIYEATDTEALASALLLMRKAGDAEMHRMGEAARHFVETEFNDEEFYSRLMEIYKGVLQ
jgi:glycosyltransferase involved in cell wall biosynthesis